MFEGEKKYGRHIFIEHLEDLSLRLTFIRFANQITKDKFKFIGFELKGKKEEIFNQML